jgi:hypothetical protein
MVIELDDTPLYLTGDIRIVWGPPMDAHRGIVWKTCTRVQWARLDSLIVVMNYGAHVFNAAWTTLHTL